MLQFIINYIEKNPAIVEQIITAVLNMILKNPTLLHSAVSIGLNKVAASTPAVSITQPTVVASEVTS
jgi:hypothetical protein